MPAELPNAVKSLEPADLEDPFRVGFYTNMSRDEITNFYRSQFKINGFGVNIKPINLNHPPEEAQQKIRDQTLSTFLEELSYPMRDTLYVNGFKPDLSKMNPLVHEGQSWERKVIIKYVKTSFPLRVLLGIVSLFILYIVLFEWSALIKSISSLSLFRKSK